MKAFNSNDNFYIYILANGRYGLTYMGITRDLIGKIYNFRKDVSRKIINRYKIHNLVYYETLDNMSDALRRKKQLNSYPREKRMELIDEKNPDWKDLYYKIIL